VQVKAVLVKINTRAAVFVWIGTVLEKAGVNRFL
jgi:hypothetical protein